MRRSVLRLLLTALVAGGVAAGAPVMGAELAAQELRLQPYRPQEQIPQSSDAAQTLESFREAWSAGDAGGVAELIPENGRATVTIEGRGVGSQMGRGQAQAVLSRLFSEAERAAFELSPGHLTDEVSVYAVGDWVYELRSAGQPQREKVFVVVHQVVPGNWGLAELRIHPVR
jgi:hypothetical protein